MPLYSPLPQPQAHACVAKGVSRPTAKRRKVTQEDALLCAALRCIVASDFLRLPLSPKVVADCHMQTTASLPCENLCSEDAGALVQLLKPPPQRHPEGCGGSLRMLRSHIDSLFAATEAALKDKPAAPAAEAAPSAEALPVGV